MALVRYAAPGTAGDKAPDPNYEYKIIPKERYVAKEFMELEWQHLWTKVWLVGGLACDVQEPGDYITTDIRGVSIVMVKGDDGKVRAFYNVCKHRGNTLAQTACGHVKTFKCSFHAWEYDRRGKLVRALDGETFPQGVSDPRLHMSEIPCEVWNGWVFFSLNPEIEPLRQFLGEVYDHLTPYRFDKMRCILDMTIEWNCNWKASVDAFNETYHVLGTHPQLMTWLDDLNVQIDCYKRHNRYLVPFGTPSPRLPNPHNVNADLRVYMQQAGMDIDQYKGDGLAVRRAIQLFKRENGKALGYDYSRLNDDQLTDDYHYMIFPHITLNVHAESFMSFRQRPHETDPNRMYYDLQMFQMFPDHGDKPVGHINAGASQATGASEDDSMTYDEYGLPKRAKHKHIKLGEPHTLGEVLDQDAWNLPFVQKGMNSPAYEGLWIGTQELRIRHFHKVIDDYVYRGQKPEGAM